MQFWQSPAYMGRGSAARGGHWLRCGASTHAGSLATKLMPAGRVSVTTTPVAPEGPALTTSRSKTSVSPATASPRACLSMDRSARTRTVVVSEASLLLGSGSGVSASTTAVFVSTVPSLKPSSGRSRITTSALAPKARGPTSHTRVPVPPGATPAQAAPVADT